MKRNFLLLLGGLLLLLSHAASAMHPIAAVVVPSGTTTTFTGAPNRGTGAVTTYNNNYYQSIDIQNGGTGVFNDGENVGQLTVRTGGTVRFGVGGEISSASAAPGSSTANTITLEPGAIIQLATPNGLPFAQGAYAANNPNDNFGNGNGPATTYTVTGAADAYYTFNGSAAQTTAAPADATRGGYASPTTSGVALPSPTSRLTLANSAGLTMVNSTGISQELHLTNGQLTVASGATLTLLSSSAGTAVLDVFSGNGTLSGSFAVQRYIDGSLNTGTGYRHLAAPVAGPTVANFANGSYSPRVNPAYNTNPATVPAASFPTVFSYDETKVGGSVGSVGFDQGWQSPATGTDALVPGRGYTVNTPPTAATGAMLSFAGTPRTTNLILSGLTHTAAAGGFQLLGNPFAAPLNWDAVTNSNTLGASSDRPAAPLYVFKSSGPYAGSYTTYVPAAPPARSARAAAAGTNIVPVGQAFFVYVPTMGASASLLLSPANTINTYAAGTTPVQRSAAAETRPYLSLSLQNAAGTQAHTTLVYFDAAATPDFDGQYDGLYLPGAGQAVALTTLAAGQDYAINALPALGRADVLVPLRLAATTAGTYTLAADELENLPAGTHAYLLDATTGTRQELTATTKVQVALAAGTALNGRYSVLFTSSTALATAPAALAQLASLYPNPAHGTTALLLPAVLRAGQPTAVVITNSLGQVVRTATHPATADELPLPLDGLAPGLYTVQARTAAGTLTRRLTVE